MVANYSSVVIKVRYFLIIYTFLIFLSCQLVNFHEELEIRLPSTENQIFHLHDYHWVLEYRDPRGTRQSIFIDSSRKSLFLNVKKGLSQSFSVYGEFKGESGIPFHTKPAGFISGYSRTTKGQYEFDWNLGFESALFLDLTAYMNLGQVNVRRLIESIEEEADSENHWIVDGLLILQEFLAGDFRTYDIRKLRIRDIEITIPGGVWCNGNLTGEDLFSESSLSPLQLEVPTGSSFYLHTSGLQLEIEVAECGSYDYIVY